MIGNRVFLLVLAAPSSSAQSTCGFVAGDASTCDGCVYTAPIDAVTFQAAVAAVEGQRKGRKEDVKR